MDLFILFSIILVVIAFIGVLQNIFSHRNKGEIKGGRFAFTIRKGEKGYDFVLFMNILALIVTVIVAILMLLRFF